MSKGYVYVLSNPCMPGIVKIGKTTRSVEDRANELYQTGVPEPFKVEEFFHSPDCHELEGIAHEALADYRVSASREFFRLPASEAIDLIQAIAVNQVDEWVTDFLPCHTTVESDMFIDPSAIHMIAQILDCQPYEVGRILEEVKCSDESVDLGALHSRYRERIERHRAQRLDETVEDGVAVPVSIKIMSQVWEREDLDPYERLVVLCLADHANDEGVCYPSVGRLCQRTGMKERGVQNVLKRLSERGVLTVQKNAGMKGANLYTVHATPAPDAPRTECTPASDAPLPPHPITCTPAPDAPEPSITTKEPSSKSDAAQVREALTAWAGGEAADSFIAFRRKIRKPLTPTAAKRIAKVLNEILSKGGDPDDALGFAEEKGWQSIEADWYFKHRKPAGGSHKADPDSDPTLRAIFGAAGAF